MHKVVSPSTEAITIFSFYPDDKHSPYLTELSQGRKIMSSKLQFLAETGRQPLWFVKQVTGVTMGTKPRTIPTTTITILSRYKHTN